jgi:hypothetical protein
MKRLPAIVTVLLAGSLSSAPAVAAPFTVGAGENPRVAVDTAGTAYVAWTEAVPDSGSAGDDVTHFCKVRRGARACAAGSARTFAPSPSALFDDDSTSGPGVFVSGAGVAVWLDRVDSTTGESVTYVAISVDGGATFAAPVVIGSHGIFSAGDVIALPSGAIATIDSFHTSGDVFQRQPLTGPPPPSTTVAQVGADGASPFESEGTLASFGTAAQDKLLAVMGQVDLPGNIGFRTYTGTGDNANDLKNWSAPAVLGPGFEPRLCSGAGAVTLLSLAGTLGHDTLEHRSFATATGRFGAPAAIDAGAVDREVCGQDAAGATTVVYRKEGAQRLWSSARPDETASLDAEDPVPRSSVAVARDGGGWVAYDNGSHVIRLQPLSDATYLSGSAVPVRGSVLAVGRVSGVVKVRVKGSKRFATLAAGKGVPPGSEVDATRGTVALASARDAKGNVQSAEFRAGRFTVAQSRRASLTTATLTGTETKSCPRGQAAAARKRVRRLFGSGKGDFRTRGHYGAATIRGTSWLVEDLCDRTKITDVHGSVEVRDLVKRKTVHLKTGQSYSAFAPRGG